MIQPLASAFRTLATRSHWSFGTDPSPELVHGILSKLSFQAPLGTPELLQVLRESALYGADAREIFTAFIAAPGPVLKQARVGVRGDLSMLKHGARAFLEDAQLGWAPVAVQVDPGSLRVGITFLEGHPLRGSVSISFLDRRPGAVAVLQRCTLEPSAPGMRRRDLLREQQRWGRIHAALVRTAGEAFSAALDW